MHLRPRLVSTGETSSLLQEAYPIGTILNAVKVIRVEKERGLIVEVGDGQEGFVHVRRVSIPEFDALIPVSRYLTSPMIMFLP